ncbi:Gfo/Idh/MocA family oxidoreductase [Agrobacterium tumefaciens]|uniref:Gfo/Idh/MocA family oxidoreductase n=1 Tax=Agrobacterium tumefaciens TaxID=358 RepID=UPI003857E877
MAHVPALRALDAFQIRAVSTTRMESANATAGRLGADLAFDTHQALVVRPEVDLVVVAVKVPDRKQIVSDALAAGRWSIANDRSRETYRKPKRWRGLLANDRRKTHSYRLDLYRATLIGRCS